MIRKAVPDDIPELLKSMKRFHDYSGQENYGLSFNEDCAANFCMVMIENQNACIYVYKKEGVIAGYIMGVAAPWSLDTSQKMCSELAWWVDPEYRNSYGSMMLLKQLEKWGKSIGATHCMMAHLDDDKGFRMHEFYSRINYNRFESHYLKRI